MPDKDLLQLSLEIQTFTALLLKFFNQAIEQRMQAHGVTLSALQLGILRMLQYETLTISALSQRFSMDPASILRIIDALEGKGLVVRGVDPHDRRRNPIHITQQGIELLTALPAVAEEDPTFQALAALGPDQVVQLRDLLFQLMLHFPDGRFVTGMLSAPPGEEPEDQAP